MSNRSHRLSDTPDQFNPEQNAMDREFEEQGNNADDAMVIVNNNEGGEEGVEMEVDNENGVVDVDQYMNRPVWVLLREDSVYGGRVDGDGYLYGGIVDGMINGEVSVLWDGEPPLPGLEQRTRVNPCDIDGFRGSGNNPVSWTGLAIHMHEDRCENGNKGIDILLVLMMGVHNHPPSISGYRSDLISVAIVDMGGNDDLLWWEIKGQAHMAEGLGYSKEGNVSALGQLRGDMTHWGWQIHPDSTGESETFMRKKSQDIHAEDSILIVANNRITSTVMNEEEINEEVRRLRGENGPTNNAVAKQDRPKIVFVVKTFKKNKLTKTTICTSKAGLVGNCVRDVCVGVNSKLVTCPACNAARAELLDPSRGGRPSNPRTVTVVSARNKPHTAELANKKTKYTIIAKYA